MTLQASGGMTIADINLEMGRSANAPLTTDDAEFRDLGLASTILPDGWYGKTFLPPLDQTISFDITIGTATESNETYYGKGVTNDFITPVTFGSASVISQPNAGRSASLIALRSFRYTSNGLYGDFCRIEIGVLPNWGGTVGSPDSLRLNLPSFGFLVLNRLSNSRDLVYFRTTSSSNDGALYDYLAARNGQTITATLTLPP